MNEVTVTDAALREAASKGSDEFLALVIDAICASVNDELTAETMAQLNADQITLALRFYTKKSWMVVLYS